MRRAKHLEEKEGRKGLKEKVEGKIKAKCLQIYCSVYIGPFQGPWLSLKFAVTTGLSLFLCFCRGFLDTLNLGCPFRIVFPGRWAQKPLQMFTTTTQAHREEMWNSCAYQCLRQHHHKKKYSKTLWLPIAAIIFEAVLSICQAPYLILHKYFPQ